MQIISQYGQSVNLCQSVGLPPLFLTSRLLQTHFSLLPSVLSALPHENKAVKHKTSSKSTVQHTSKAYSQIHNRAGDLKRLLHLQYNKTLLCRL